VPDITIVKEGDEYEVRLVEEGLPQLRINGFYRRMYRSGTLERGDREFIEKKVNSARWLIKSILQRQETILKVTRSIVKFQRDSTADQPPGRRSCARSPRTSRCTSRRSAA
jgi:RNA polymerase sigma-54 factor